MTTTKKHELCWQEFNAKGAIVTKRKVFSTQSAMTKFIDKLTEKGNLYQIYGTREI